MAGDIIKIEGLVEFQRSLKALDGKSQKQLRVIFNKAAEIVAVDARKRTPVKSGRARNSIRALSQQRRAVVAGGSAKVRYFGFLDYGGKAGPRSGQGAQKRGRPFIPTGRILYPAFRNEQPVIQEMMEQDLAALVRSVGWEVK